jgi:hypothetical protein
LQSKPRCGAQNNLWRFGTRSVTFHFQPALQVYRHGITIFPVFKPQLLAGKWKLRHLGTELEKPTQSAQSERLTNDRKVWEPWGPMRLTLISFWNLPFCPFTVPKHAVSTTGKGQGSSKQGDEPQILILSNLCLMSAPVAVVNHQCTLACLKIACMLRPINPVYRGRFHQSSF